MSAQFLFYDGADETFSAHAPHSDIPLPSPQTLKHLYFNPSEFPSADSRRSAANGILWLPFNSIVAAFASGHGTYPPAPGLVPCACVVKNWHQNPNQHISVLLGWRDGNGNAERNFAMAHVHRNGLEVVFEARTGGTLVRAYEEEGFAWYGPGEMSELRKDV